MQTESNMGPAGLRVAIAKDVLARLESEGYNAIKGTYILSPAIDDLVRTGGDAYITDHLDDIDGTTCHVCALGGAVMSLMRLRDGYTFNDVFHLNEKNDLSIEWDDLRRILTRVFSPRQIALIEMAYEGEPFLYRDEDDGDEEFQRAVALGKAHSWLSDRMKAIWQNVVDNEGEFKP